MMSEPERLDRVTAFYDRWAVPYDHLARHAPLVGRLRERAVAGLALEAGDTVVDMGCGPGVNLGLLRAAVRPDGRVVGLDLSSAMLVRAATDGDRTVGLVRGDVTAPPIQAGVDGILSTFVVTLFDEPGRIVETWWELLEPGGRLAILNVGPVRGDLGRWIDPALQVGLRLSTPTSDELDHDLVGVLDERVTAAHAQLTDLADRVEYEERAGLLRLVIGTKGID